MKKAEEFGRELLRGFVITLHKDRPTQDEEQSHEITLDVKYGLGRRQVKLRLLPRQYRQALKWQDSNREVDLDAIIDKRGHVWTVAALFSLTAADDRGTTPGLFGSDQ